MAAKRYDKWISAEGLACIEGWARDGLTAEQIGKNIGISLSALYRWRDKFPELARVMDLGRDAADRIVENALYKSACGYQVVEEIEELRFNRATGKQEMVVVKRTVRQVAPNVTAQIFWLKNRKPHDWRDKREVEMSGELQTNPFAGLSEEQLKKLAKEDE